MKILFVTTHLNFGGIPSYIINLASYFKKKGIKTGIASGGGVLEKEAENLGIPHFFIPILTKSEISPKVFFSAVKLKKIINDNAYTLIHANKRVAQVAVGSLSSCFKIPVVTTAHGFYKDRIGRKIFPCWGDRIIAVSQKVKNHLMADFKIPSCNIDVIYNGIDILRFSPDTRKKERDKIRQKLQISRQCPVIGTVSRFSGIKGIDRILNAVVCLKKEFPSIKCLITGQGKEEKNIKNLIDSLKLKENVIIVPGLWKTEKILSAMDVFVSASLQEGLGLSIIESMGCGIPVAGAASGGVVEIIEDKINGLLFPNEEENLMASKIGLLLKDVSLSKKISFNARQTVIKKFSMERAGFLTAETYKKVL